MDTSGVGTLVEVVVSRDFLTAAQVRALLPSDTDAVTLTLDQHVRALHEKRKNAQDVGLIDLFCGCGGFSAGASLAGMNIIKGFDSEQTKISTYNQLKNNRNKNNLGQAYTITDASELFEKIKAEVEGESHVHIHASPPCVDLSSGNRKSGERTTSWNLFGIVIDMLKMCADQPWFYSYSIEDGPEITQPKNAGYFDKLFELREKLMLLGWINHSTAVVEAARHGLPQSRKRFYAMGCKDPHVQLAFNGVETMLIQEKRRNPQRFWADRAQVQRTFKKLLDVEQLDLVPTSMETALKLYLGVEYDHQYWTKNHGDGITRFVPTHRNVFQSKPINWGWEEDGTVKPITYTKNEQGEQVEINKFDELARNLYDLDKISHSFTKSFGQQWLYVDNVDAYKEWLKQQKREKTEIRKESAPFSFHQLGPSDMLGEELKALGGFPKNFKLNNDDLKQCQACVGDSVPPFMSLLLASPIVKSGMNDNPKDAVLKYVYEGRALFSDSSKLITLFRTYLNEKDTLAPVTVDLYVLWAGRFIKQKKINYIVQYDNTNPRLNHRQNSSGMMYFANFRDTSAFEEWMIDNERIVMEQFRIDPDACNRFTTLLQTGVTHPDKSPDKFWLYPKKGQKTRAELNELIRKKPSQTLYVLDVRQGFTKQPTNKRFYTPYVAYQYLSFWNGVIKAWKKREESKPKSQVRALASSSPKANLQQVYEQNKRIIAKLERELHELLTENNTGDVMDVDRESDAFFATASGSFVSALHQYASTFAKLKAHVVFRVDAEGINIVTFASPRLVLCETQMMAHAFDVFQCKSPVEIGVDLTELSRVLGANPATLEFKIGAEELRMSLNNQPLSNVWEYAADEYARIHSTHLPTVDTIIIMPFTEFAHMIRTCTDAGPARLQCVGNDVMLNRIRFKNSMVRGEHTADIRFHCNQMSEAVAMSGFADDDEVELHVSSGFACVVLKNVYFGQLSLYVFLSPADEVAVERKRMKMV